MPRKVKDLVKELPELLEKLGKPHQTADELRAMGAKELRKLEKDLKAEEKEIDDAAEAAAVHKHLASLPAGKAKVSALVAAAKAKKGKKADLVSAEEAKVLDQTESAFLPGAVVESTKKLVTGAKPAPSTREKAEKALEEVGITVVRKAKAQKKPVAKVDVQKVVREVESEMKLLEAEKKGLLKSKEAKQKARDIRFAKASSEEAAEMNVKEGAAKAKALLGKVKEAVVHKVAERKKRVHKVKQEEALAPHAEKKPRKTALRTHKIPVDAPVVPVLGHPHVPKVHPVAHKYDRGVDRELMRIGISV